MGLFCRGSEEGIPSCDYRLRDRSLDHLRAFWQARFYDFNVYSERKRIEKLNYMQANPIHRKLVKDPKDWPWSSWGFYTRVGRVLTPIDV